MRKFINQYETEIVIAAACFWAVVLELTVVLSLYPNL